MSSRLLLVMCLRAATALGGTDDEPLPAGTKIRILNIEARVVDMEGDSRAVASSASAKRKAMQWKARIPIESAANEEI